MDLTTSQLEDWIEGKDMGVSMYFVAIKSKACTKCAELKSEMGRIFGRLAGNVGWYVFDPKDAGSRNAVQRLGVIKAPGIAFRFFGPRGYDTCSVRYSDDDFTDLKCIIDAVNENDQRYFGYNEYGETVDDDASYEMHRLLKLIHGEGDPAKIRERKIFKAELNN